VDLPVYYRLVKIKWQQGLPHTKGGHHSGKDACCREMRCDLAKAGKDVSAFAFCIISIPG
jgi:hypothetical protein